jgi:hypothetical protein
VDRKKEILANSQQIQEQAQRTLNELPLRLAKGTDHYRFAGR